MVRWTSGKAPRPTSNKNGCLCLAPDVAQWGRGGLSAGQLFQWLLYTGRCGGEQHSHGEYQTCPSIDQSHSCIDQMVLTDPQLLQVTAFVPGGDTLISSGSLTMTEKRNRVFTILDSVLRQRFADMRNVGFLLLTAHPSSKWMDPAFSQQKEKVLVVYSDDVLQGSASVLLRLSLPPHDAEGAIYVRRRLRLRYLIRQLGISLLCGDAGAECLCYVNGMELSNDREMAVDDAAFIHCWGLPAADSEEADLITIGDSISQHSVDVHMPVSEFALTSPCDHRQDGASS